jgi:hypothetical protein
VHDAALEVHLFYLYLFAAFLVWGSVRRRTTGYCYDCYCLSIYLSIYIYVPGGAS